MAAKGQDIVSVIKQQIEKFGLEVTMTDIGTVVEVGDGIARIHGLAGCKYNELLEFPNKVIGIALNLEEDGVSAIIMGDFSKIKEGDEVKTTGRIAEVLAKA
jgi:F-type H+-transporting ATPase subunit alpha